METRQQTETWSLRLYVLDGDPKSLRALNNVKRICDRHIEREYQLEVVDLKMHPQLAKADQIVALPTLMRLSPKPCRAIIGDLSNIDRVLASLEL